MPAAGPRIGEAAGATWDAMDLDAGTVEVRVVRLEGVGLSIKWRPKSRSGYRTLELPGWAVEMLRRRREKARANEWSVVFTAPLGGLRDPSNTQADLRVVFADAGHPWVTSHVYRKTVATLMDAALRPEGRTDGRRRSAVDLRSQPSRAEKCG
jgi:integrase